MLIKVRFVLLVSLGLLAAGFAFRVCELNWFFVVCAYWRLAFGVFCVAVALWWVVLDYKFGCVRGFDCYSDGFWSYVGV